MDKLEILRKNAEANYLEYDALSENSYKMVIMRELLNIIKYDNLTKSCVEKLSEKTRPITYLYEEYLESSTINIKNELMLLFETLEEI